MEAVTTKKKNRISQHACVAFLTRVCGGPGKVKILIKAVVRQEQASVAACQQTSAHRLRCSTLAEDLVLALCACALCSLCACILLLVGSDVTSPQTLLLRLHWFMQVAPPSGLFPGSTLGPVGLGPRSPGPAGPMRGPAGPSDRLLVSFQARPDGLWPSRSWPCGPWVEILTPATT